MTGLGLLLCLSGAAEAAPDPQEAAKQAIQTLDLQTALPDGAALPPAVAWHLPPDLASALLWGALVLGIGVVIWSLWDSMPVFDRSRRIALMPEGGGAAAGEGMEEAQMEADDLANTGQFVEAMHVLLLQSLAEMRQRLGLRFAQSLTSREILRLSAMSATARDALATIIRDVERTYFGTQAATIQDYRACRDNFEAFKLALTQTSAT